MSLMKRTLIPLLLFIVSYDATAQQPAMQLWYDQPATYFEESLPIGNGKLGALIYGNPDDDIIQLNDITLWSGKPIDRKEDAGASVWIPKIREALFREDYRAADSLQLHVQGHNSCYYMPLGTLHIADLNEGEVSHYRRQLDLDSALASTIYQKGGRQMRREYLMSYPDNTLAIRLEGDVNVRLTLNSQLNHQTRTTGHQLVMTGHATGNPRESIHFCTMLKVHTDGTVTANDTSLVITDSKEAVIYLVNETSFNGFDKHPVAEGAPYMEKAADDLWHTENLSYTDIRRRHIDDYRQFYARVSLSLGGLQASRDLPTNQLLLSYSPRQADINSAANSSTAQDRYLETLYFQFGRYLLISCSRTPGVPANLQGLWNPHLKAPWRGNYTININLEENYWPAFVANLPEMAMPLDGFVSALAENGRYTSENYYGIHHGWSAGHNSDIWAMANPVGEKNEKPEWANWPLGGAWLVETLWEKYLFTQDKDYLRLVAYPLMKGATEFCLDWLIENPNNKEELITAPSTSPENEYVTDEGYHGMTCYGGTADLAIIRELFLNTLQAASVLGDKSATTAAITATLPRLHPYTIGKEGDLNEWYYDWKDYDPKHRHQSHLIGLYPGHHLTNDEVVKNACEQTLIQKGEKTTGWSTGWRINLWARLHKGEQAYHIYQKLLEYVPAGPRRKGQGGGTYPNLFDAHPPFQIDGNFGGTAGVCEMLVQSVSSSQGTVIELLPALPTAWKDGEVKGLCARGGYEVDICWKEGQVVKASIKAIKDGAVTILYNNETKTLKLKAGQTKTIQD